MNQTLQMMFQIPHLEKHNIFPTTQAFSFPSPFTFSPATSECIVLRGKAKEVYKFIVYNKELGTCFH